MSTGHSDAPHGMLRRLVAQATGLEPRGSDWECDVTVSRPEGEALEITRDRVRGIERAIADAVSGVSVSSCLHDARANIGGVRIRVTRWDAGHIYAARRVLLGEMTLREFTAECPHHEDAVRAMSIALVDSYTYDEDGDLRVH